MLLTGIQATSSHFQTESLSLNSLNDTILQCNVCLEAKRRYRENHSARVERQAKKYYNQNKEERTQYGKIDSQIYTHIYICLCDVCH